jgi:DNA-binding NarL/FixJ family response regulator
MVTIDLALQPLQGRDTDAGDDTAKLTRRELEIIHHVALGQRAHEIAEELFIAPTTVQPHLRNAMAKVGARSQAQLVTFAFCHGLLDAGFIREMANR